MWSHVADLDITNEREGGREEGRESVGGMESEKTTMPCRDGGPLKFIFRRGRKFQIVFVQS